MRFVVVLAALAAVSTAGLAGQVQESSREVLVGEHQIFNPGYAIGDVSVANVDVADYQVSRSRRDLTVLGRRPGSTTILIADQQSRRWFRLQVTVIRRLDSATRNVILAAIKQWSDVRLEDLRVESVLSGHVHSESELAQVVRLAEATGVKSVVVRRDAPPNERAPIPPVQVPRAFGFDLELLEAAISFSTGTFGEGVQPSGRSLYKTRLDIRAGSSGQTFVGGIAAGRPAKGATTGGARAEVGLRLTLSPGLDEPSIGQLDVRIECNLPIAYDLYRVDEMRVFQKSFSLTPVAPFAIAGNDALAAPDLNDARRKGPRILSSIIGLFRLPGLNQAPGLQYVPVFGELAASPLYRGGRTQLLVMVRPTQLFVAAAEKR